MYITYALCTSYVLLGQIVYSAVIVVVCVGASHGSEEFVLM